MAVVHWTRGEAIGSVDPLAVDDLDGVVLVLEGIQAVDDPHLSWLRRAPCLVIGVTPAGGEPATVPDVIVDEGEADVLGSLVDRATSNPQAARVLADVLRPMPDLDVPTGLTLESLGYSMLLAGSEFADWRRERQQPKPRAHTGEPVRVERVAGELRLTLARPENRNAFSAQLRDALWEALTLALVDGEVDRVVLDADGPVFSSGGDLTEFGTAPGVVRAHEVRTLRSVGALLSELSARTTVHVHGACVGAGVELPAFAGHVVAGPDATFRLPEVGMGLIPGAGGTVSITHRIGRQATARLAVLGEPIDAGAALVLGLVDEVRAR